MGLLRRWVVGGVVFLALIVSCAKLMSLIETRRKEGILLKVCESIERGQSAQQAQALLESQGIDSAYRHDENRIVGMVRDVNSNLFVIRNVRITVDLDSQGRVLGVTTKDLFTGL